MSDKDFHDYIIYDVMSDISGVTSKRMFGGYGIYKDEILFAIISDGKLYFKVGEYNRADFEKAGSKPLMYSTKKKENIALSYWELPADIMEDKEQLKRWVSGSMYVKEAKK